MRWIRPRRLYLTRALIAALVAFALVPVAIAAVFAFTQLQRVVHQQVETTLRVAADLAQATVVQFLGYLKARTLDVASDWYIENSLARGRTGRELDRYLGINRAHIPESDEIFVLDRGGRVIASSDPSSIGRDDSALVYFARGRTGVYVDDPVRDVEGNVRWVVAAPIVDHRSAAFLGVLATRVDVRALSDLTTGRRFLQLGGRDDGMRRGQTSEVYIVDGGGFMLTESRFVPGTVLTTKVATRPIRLASRGERTLGDYHDYRGIAVTGASALVPEKGWVVLAEIDAEEAVRPIHELQRALALLGLGLLPAVVAFGLMLRHSIAHPIGMLIAADERVFRDGPASGIIDDGAVPYVEWRRVVAGRNAMLARLDEQSTLLRDRLEREREYRDAREADRRKDQFLAMLAHELRGPLGAISNAVHVLEGLPPGDARQSRFRGIVRRQMGHVTSLLEDLMDVARIGSGKMRLRARRIDLRDVARAAVEAMEAAGRTADHDVALATAAEPVPVHGDPARLEQVVRNLLDNALKYSPPGTRVDVTVTRDGDAALVRVKDEGLGIPAEELATVFEPFAQSQASLASARGGLGLGLALVRGLVELHGGRVSAASAGTGRGSEFTVTLPLVAILERAAPERPEAPSVTPLRILLVEDDPDAREALQAVLERDGHRVRVAGNGREAVKLAQAECPEVALVDIGLPELDGHQVARTIRAARAGGAVRLIAISAHGQPEDRQRSLESGFETHLVKPIDLDELRRVLADHAV